VPTKRCAAGGKPGWKWGEGGRCYTYAAGDDAGSKLARRKAVNQGIAMGDIEVEGVQAKVAAALRGEVPVADAVRAAAAGSPEREALLSLARLVNEGTVELGDDESLSDLMDSVRVAVAARYGDKAYPCHVYSDSVIVEFYGDSPRVGRSFRIGWARGEEGMVELVGDEVEVRRVTTYEPV
jgi:hypothetical protein